MKHRILFSFLALIVSLGLVTSALAWGTPTPTGGTEADGYWAVTSSVVSGPCSPDILRPSLPGGCPKPPIWAYKAATWYGQTAFDSVDRTYTPFVKVDMTTPENRAKWAHCADPGGPGGKEILRTACEMAIQCPILKVAGIELPGISNNPGARWLRNSWPHDADKLYICLHPSGR